MNKIWQTEKAAIFFTVGSILLTGIVFQNWIVAILLPLVSYIIWIYFRLYQLEKWLSHGTKASQVFNDNGFIGLIIRHLYIQKKVSNKQKKTYQRNITPLKHQHICSSRRYRITKPEF